MLGIGEERISMVDLTVENTRLTSPAYACAAHRIDGNAVVEQGLENALVLGHLDRAARAAEMNDQYLARQRGRLHISGAGWPTPPSHD